VREGPTPDTTFPIGGNKYVRFIKNTTRVDQRSEKTMTDDKSFADGSAITPHPTTRYMLTRRPIAVVTKGIANEQCGEIAPESSLRLCLSSFRWRYRSTKGPPRYSILRPMPLNPTGRYIWWPTVGAGALLPVMITGQELKGIGVEQVMFRSGEAHCAADLMMGAR
jgi:hypothetical protein